MLSHKSNIVVHNAHFFSDFNIKVNALDVKFGFFRDFGFYICSRVASLFSLGISTDPVVGELSGGPERALRVGFLRHSSLLGSNVASRLVEGGIGEVEGS